MPVPGGRGHGRFCVAIARNFRAPKVRERSEKFFDHFSQARLFYESQTDIEKDHIVSAFRFELGKVEVPEIRERMVTILNQIDSRLAERVAMGLGLTGSMKPLKPINQSVPADGDIAAFQPRDSKNSLKPSRELSIVLSAGPKTAIRTRKIAILAADGCDDADLNMMLQALTAEGAQAKIVAPRLGYLQTADGTAVKIHFSLLTSTSVLFDAVYVPGGEKSVAALKRDPFALEFVLEAYKHAKAIAASGAGTQLVEQPGIPDVSDSDDAAVVVAASSLSKAMVSKFFQAIGKHRNWQREKKLRVDLQQPSGPARRSA